MPLQSLGPRDAFWSRDHGEKVVGGLIKGVNGQSCTFYLLLDKTAVEEDQDIIKLSSMVDDLTPHQLNNLEGAREVYIDKSTVRTGPLPSASNVMCIFDRATWFSIACPGMAYSSLYCIAFGTIVIDEDGRKSAHRLTSPCFNMPVPAPHEGGLDHYLDNLQAPCVLLHRIARQVRGSFTGCLSLHASETVGGVQSTEWESMSIADVISIVMPLLGLTDVRFSLLASRGKVRTSTPSSIERQEHIAMKAVLTIVDPRLFTSLTGRFWNMSAKNKFHEGDRDGRSYSYGVVDMTRLITLTVDMTNSRIKFTFMFLKVTHSELAKFTRFADPVVSSIEKHAVEVCKFESGYGLPVVVLVDDMRIVQGKEYQVAFQVATRSDSLVVPKESRLPQIKDKVLVVLAAHVSAYNDMVQETLHLEDEVDASGVPVAPSSSHVIVPSKVHAPFLFQSLIRDEVFDGLVQVYDASGLRWPTVESGGGAGAGDVIATPRFDSIEQAIALAQSLNASLDDRPRRRKKGMGVVVDADYRHQPSSSSSPSSMELRRTNRHLSDDVLRHA